MMNILEHGQKQVTLDLQKDNAQAVFRCSNDVGHPDKIDMNQVFPGFIKQIPQAVAQFKPTYKAWFKITGQIKLITSGAHTLSGIGIS